MRCSAISGGVKQPPKEAHVGVAFRTGLCLVACPEAAACREMTEELKDELAELRKEAKRERAGQGRKHILRSVEKTMGSI